MTLTTHIAGPARWAPYLLGTGEIAPEEQAMAADWCRREGVRIVGLEPSARSYWSRAARVLAPELGRVAAAMLDYRAEELTIDAEAA